MEGGDDGSFVFRVDPMFWRRVGEQIINRYPLGSLRPTKGVRGTNDTRRVF